MALKRIFRLVARTIVVGFACLVLVAYIAHWVWGYVAAKELERQIIAIKQTGEPLFPADFSATPSYGSENAINVLQNAGEGVNRQSDAWKRATDDVALPLTDKERKAIGDVIAEGIPALERIDYALGLSRVEWSINPYSPVIHEMLPQLGWTRTLAELLGIAAIFEHDRGDDTATIKRLIQMIRLGDVSGKHPSIVGHLVSLGITSLGANRTVMVAAELKPDTTNSIKSDLSLLIGSLLNDRATTASYRSAFLGERMFELAVVQSIMKKPDDISQINWNSRAAAIQPYVDSNATVLLDFMTKVLGAPIGDDLPAAYSTFPRLPRDLEAGSWRYRLAAIFSPSLSRFVEVHYRNMADRRLAAAALAIRWYAIEHEGVFPDSLNQLVPKYLPAVPNDPMLAGGKPLHYQPSGDKPMIYSVGTDRVDDGGSDSPVKESSYFDQWGLRDRVVYLKRQPRKPPEEELPEWAN